MYHEYFSSFHFIWFQCCVTWCLPEVTGHVSCVQLVPTVTPQIFYIIMNTRDTLSMNFQWPVLCATGHKAAVNTEWSLYKIMRLLRDKTAIGHKHNGSHRSLLRYKWDSAWLRYIRHQVVTLYTLLSPTNFYTFREWLYYFDLYVVSWLDLTHSIH